jgi:hypothetical protein
MHALHHRRRNAFRPPARPLQRLPHKSLTWLIPLLLIANSKAHTNSTKRKIGMWRKLNINLQSYSQAKTDTVRFWTIINELMLMESRVLSFFREANERAHNFLHVTFVSLKKSRVCSTKK